MAKRDVRRVYDSLMPLYTETSKHVINRITFNRVTSLNMIIENIILDHTTWKDDLRSAGIF